MIYITEMFENASWLHVIKGRFSKNNIFIFSAKDVHFRNSIYKLYKKILFENYIFQI